MGCGASTAAKSNGSGPAAPVTPVAPAAAAAAPARKAPGAWTAGSGIQFWRASASHRDPISVSGDTLCRKPDLKKVVIMLDPRHLGFNSDFVKAVRKTLFKHKERTHGAADWDAIDTGAGYSAGLKIRTLLITATPRSGPAFCTAIEASIYGMAFVNTLCGSGWKGADKMLKIALADDFYADPDGVLYKLYGQYDEAGNAGKSSKWKAFCSGGKSGVDDMMALKAKFEKDLKPTKAYAYLADQAGLQEAEYMSALDNLCDFISKTITSDANVATAKSTTRDMEVEQPMKGLTENMKNVSWPSNRRPVGFSMSSSAMEQFKPRFDRFERPFFDVSAEIPDGNADDAAAVAATMIAEKVINRKKGHHQRKPIVMIGVKALEEDRLARFNVLMQAMSENESCGGITTIIHAPSYEEFAENALCAAAVSKAMKLSTGVVVCLTDELERVVEMFLAPSNEAIVDSIRVCMMPFPGMKLFTTHNAMGREISEGGILTTEFMVGNPGTGKTGAHMKKIQERLLPLNKFAATVTRQLVLSDMNGDKKVHRIRMATKYDPDLKPISLIIPSRVLAGFLNAIAGSATDDAVASHLTGYAEALVRVAEGGAFDA
ncbi:unnamed protein product [Amoebophrya sp. A25]|nr:unnamed protein product [Amoebophrya sp. A25]|eukprot:GSA25T00025293001.1